MARRGVVDNQTFIIPLSYVKIDPSRQREDVGDISGLAKSISVRGQLTPIIIADDGTLIAGERRIRALESLGETQVLARYYGDLSPSERQLLEWDENFHRKDLHWTEQAKTIVKFHELQNSLDDNWTVDQTAESLGVSRSLVSKYLLVGRALATHDPQLMACETFRAALNVVERRASRERDNEINKFFVAQQEVEYEETEEESLEVTNLPDAAPVSKDASLKATDLIITADFHQWATTYRGKPFNFIHLDPPYGIEHDKSSAGGAARFGAYDDTKDHYFQFLRTLVENRQRLLMYKSHVMLWFSMKYYSETVKYLTEKLSDEIRLCPFPLIWHKDDGTGLMPDSQREPKRVYETALFFSLNDRTLVRPVSNLMPYSGAKHDALHLSEKPVPMLGRFFTMFIDRSTRMLDPCVGSGNSLAAAAMYKPEYLFGMDINPEYVETARTRLQQALLL